MIVPSGADTVPDPAERWTISANEEGEMRSVRGTFGLT
jgi:hypothetical protein